MSVATDSRKTGIQNGGAERIATLGAGVSAIGSVETIVLQALRPAGAWRVNESIRIWFTVNKSGGTDTLNASVRVGTTGTTADTQVVTGAFLAAANLTGGFILELKLLSSTSVQRVGTITTSTAYGGGTNGAIAPAVTISDASANSLYVSLGISSSGATNTVSILTGQMEQILA